MSPGQTAKVTLFASRVNTINTAIQGHEKVYRSFTNILRAYKCKKKLNQIPIKEIINLL